MAAISGGDQPPRVSVIIPCYGREDYALEAVESARNQDYPNLEIIVADDASPDTRFEAIAQLGDPRVRLVRNATNMGRAANYRQALYRLATGKWALVLDGDDYLTDTGFVRSAVEAGEADSSIVIVAGRARTVGPNRSSVSPSPGETVIEGKAMLAQMPRPEFFLMHLATLYRRDAALALDFYRVPELSSDWESLYRLAATGRVAFIDKVAGVWRIHGDNATACPDPAALARNLDVWPSIFAGARASGLSEVAAKSACRACLTFFLRDQIPSLFRGTDRLGTWRRYLAELSPESRAVLPFALSSPRSLARLGLGLSGYYRGRSF